MAATATRVLRVRRPVASAAVTGSRILSASAAVTGSRSLSAFFAEELKTMEDDLEARLGVKMQKYFETRVAAIVRSEVTKDFVASEGAMINREMNMPALMKNAEDKQEVYFKAKLAEHKIWTTTKINATDRAMTKASLDVMNSACSNSNECDKKAHATKLKIKNLQEKQQFLNDNDAGRQLHRLSLLKAVAYVVSVPSAIYGAATRFYFGRRGGK